MLKKFTAALICTILVFMGTYGFAAPSDWALEEVGEAVTNGIVPVSLQGNYQNYITRAEFCKLVISFYGKLDKLPDEVLPSPFNDTADKDIATAYQLGIVKGTDVNIFSPDALVTRQEMCTMLARAAEIGMPGVAVAESYACEYPDQELIADWAVTSVGFMSVYGAIFGDENSNINPLGNTTREQAILFSGRLYNVLYKESIRNIVGVFMPSNGNTPANIQAGGFAIATPGVGVYFSSSKGIVLVSEQGQSSVKTTEKADVITTKADGTIYYKKSSDGKVYKLDSRGEESVLIDVPVKTFVQAGAKIYYITLEDNKLFALADEEKTESFAYDDIDFPVLMGAGIYFGADGISYAADGEVKKIYEGKATSICIENGKLYFINGDGNLSEIGLQGSGYKVLSGVLAKQIIPISTCIVVLGQDGHVYRADYSGRGTVKIDNGIYKVLNTFGSTIYGKTAEDEIVSFSVYGIGKTNIEL